MTNPATVENVQRVLLICKCEVGETYCAAAPVVSNCAASYTSLAYLMNSFAVCGVKKAGVHDLACRTVSLMLAVKKQAIYLVDPSHDHRIINIFQPPFF